MARGFDEVHTVLDLVSCCDGVDLIVVYLILLGLRQNEIADLMNTSRQAVNDRLSHIQARYHAGKRKHIMGRPKKNR